MASMNFSLKLWLGSVEEPTAYDFEGAVDSEAAFLASIASLAPEEQQKRLWYRRLAQRQALMEVERRR